MIERERKFLVRNSSFLEGHHFSLIVQGYVFVGEDCAVRVRRERSSGKELTPFLAVKGASRGGVREKFEMEISFELAGTLMLASVGKVVKLRYQLVDQWDQIWSIDAFQFQHAGLVLAELEVAPGAKAPSLPSWCGREVTDDLRYLNQSLALDPTQFYA